ncbi:unnamed protein product [Heterosigma akashiwo]
MRRCRSSPFSTAFRRATGRGIATTPSPLPFLRLQKRGLHLAPPFLIEDYEPVGISTMEKGLMKEKLELANSELRDCKACPRKCGVNRLDDQRGVCRVGRKAIVSSAFPHFGEESVLQGFNGSGTIFFGSCNMRCVFCQNWDISQRRKSGWELDAHEIADLMLKLQDETRCHNINLVTPEHVAPQVVQALEVALRQGLKVPVVYNTSAYDALATLRMMDGLVDIYLPDFKFWEPATAARLAKAPDYPAVARAALLEMQRQVGDLRFDPATGLARRGVLLRHLVMPGLAGEGAALLRWAARAVSRDLYVHVMEQYRPAFRVGRPGAGDLAATGGGGRLHADLARPASPGEVERVRAAARAAGLWRFEEAREW